MANSLFPMSIKSSPESSPVAKFFFILLTEGGGRRRQWLFACLSATTGNKSCFFHQNMMNFVTLSSTNGLFSRAYSSIIYNYWSKFSCAKLSLLGKNLFFLCPLAKTSGFLLPTPLALCKLM